MKLTNSYQNKLKEQKVHETQKRTGRVCIETNEGLQQQWQTQGTCSTVSPPLNLTDTGNR